MNTRFTIPSRSMGMVNLSTVEGRTNLTKTAVGVAMGGAALYSINQVKNARGMNQIAWGALSGGLLLGSLLSIYDGLSS